MDYKNSGVDIEAGYKSVELMKEHVKKTMREEVLGGLGGFAGAFSLAKIKEMEEPVLLSVFPGLYCLRQELSGKDRGYRKRRCRRLLTVGGSSDRRRDSRASGTDAGGRL